MSAPGVHSENLIFTDIRLARSMQRPRVRRSSLRHPGNAAARAIMRTLQFAAPP